MLIKAEQRPVSVHKIGRPRESKLCNSKGDGNSTGSQGRVVFSRDALTYCFGWQIYNLKFFYL